MCYIVLLEQVFMCLYGCRSSASLHSVDFWSKKRGGSIQNNTFSAFTVSQTSRMSRLCRLFLSVLLCFLNSFTTHGEMFH